MTTEIKNKSDSIRDYLIKIAVTAILFYSTADLAQNLGFIEIFGHPDYTLFWPPSGVALGLMLVWGISVWPGILIASLFLINTSWFHLEYPALLSTLGITTCFFTGRILEPMIGYSLIRKFNLKENPFNTPQHAFHFLLITLIIALISSSIAATGYQLIRHDNLEVWLTRIAGWYISNVIGILIFTPMTFSLFYKIRKKSYPSLASLITLLLVILYTFYEIYWLKDTTRSLHIIIENALPFLIIPLLLWAAFKFSLMTISVIIFLVSTTLIYYTYLGHGPFVTHPNIIQHTVWLLQCFLFLISASCLITNAVSHQLKEDMDKRMKQTEQLEQTRQALLVSMNELSLARHKAQESDRLKSSFLSNMSHEIRNPMNAIVGISELLDRFDLTDEKRKELSVLINEQSEKLLGIINNILLISQLEINQKKPLWIQTDLANLFDELSHQYTAKAQRNSEISFTRAIHLNQDDHIILADPVKLKIVLTNLLDNAFKFTKKGRIMLSCTKRDAHTLLFHVSDTGTGIPENQYSHIFHPFRQANGNTQQQQGGTGLGLAICKMIVTSWDGKIWLESVEGEGSGVYFTLPHKRETVANVSAVSIT